jgi:hypothetical protein
MAMRTATSIFGGVPPGVAFRVSQALTAQPGEPRGHHFIDPN